MKKHGLGWVGLMIGFLWGAMAASAARPATPETPPAIVVGEVFQFLPGSWAEYDMLDRTKNLEYRMRVAMLEPQRIRPRWWSLSRQTYHWMEIEVAGIPDTPGVIIQCLVRQTAEGPGDINRIILQIEGYEDPMLLKRRWIRSNEGEVINPNVEWSGSAVDTQDVTHRGRTFPVWRVQSVDENGRTLEAIVSEHLPPFGLYLADTPDLRMQLTDWGMEAKGRITGTPIGLSRWILRQVRGGLAQPAP